MLSVSLNKTFPSKILVLYFVVTVFIVVSTDTSVIFIVVSTDTSVIFISIFKP